MKALNITKRVLNQPRSKVGKLQTTLTAEHNMILATDNIAELD